MNPPERRFQVLAFRLQMLKSLASNTFKSAI
jgi:hypothetical protein